MVAEWQFFAFVVSLQNSLPELYTLWGDFGEKACLMNKRRSKDVGTE